MNDTCATHRSRVPRRSFGRNKRRSDDIGRRERTRPGFYFMFCVRQSSARGCRFSVMFGYFVIKMFKCSPVPASFFPYIRTALHWCRNPGARQRVFRPTCSSFAPAPPLRAATGGLRHFLLPDLLSTAIPLSSEGSLTACPSFLPGFGTNVTQFVYTGRRRREPANI